MDRVSTTQYMETERSPEVYYNAIYKLNPFMTALNNKIQSSRDPISAGGSWNLLHVWAPYVGPSCWLIHFEIVFKYILFIYV